MDILLRDDFSHSMCLVNTYEGREPIMAVYRMNGDKVSVSLGVLQDGTAVCIDKLTDDKTTYTSKSPEAKAIRVAVKDEHSRQGYAMPPQFLLALTL